MPSGTTLYLTLVFTVLIAVCIPLGLRMVSRYVFAAPLRSRKAESHISDLMKDTPPKLNTRFFVGLNSAVLIALCLLLLYPLTHLFRDGSHPGTLTRAVILIFFSSLFLGIALVLLHQKKLLQWQGSHAKSAQEAPKG